MRPPFSVMHSPRLTKRNGVLTRTAPPNTANGTSTRPECAPRHALTPPAWSLLSRGDATVDRIAGQDRNEDDALQHDGRGVGQAKVPLQQPAAGANPAEQHRDRDQRQRVLAGEKGDEDAGVAIASDQIGAGALLHGRDLDHAGKASRSASQEAGHQGQACPIGNPIHARRPSTLPPAMRAAKPIVVWRNST